MSLDLSLEEYFCVKGGVILRSSSSFYSSLTDKRPMVAALIHFDSVKLNVRFFTY